LDFKSEENSLTQLKTTPHQQSVEKFLKGISDPARQHDCFNLLAMMKKITGSAPKMWGNCIVGSCSCHYIYEGGREGDWFLNGFSPRKQSLTIYIKSDFKKQGETGKI
jgi:hypothetical protein